MEWVHIKVPPDPWYGGYDSPRHNSAGSLVVYKNVGVQMFACCIWGLRFDSKRVDKIKSWMLLWFDVKLAIPCTTVYDEQLKDPTQGVNVKNLLESCSYHLIDQP